jgi:lipoprotein-releasing system permease protein
MYKIFLCWRYLRTRWIALASVVSVTLGVATMIVVNSVMEGFATEMQDRIHGILSDVVFESNNLEGFYDADAHMTRIREVAGKYIAGMTPTVAVPGQLAFEVDGHMQTRHVSYIGVDPNTYGSVSDFSRYLRHPKNRKQLDFQLRDGGYEAGEGESADVRGAGWPHRWRKNEQAKTAAATAPVTTAVASTAAAEPPPEILVRDGYKYHRAREVLVIEDAVAGQKPANPFASPFAARDKVAAFDPARDTHSGIILGIGLARVISTDGKKFLVLPGDDVKVTVPTAATPPKTSFDTFTIVDLYESQMTEYDANFIFMPLRRLQELRGMIAPQTGIGNVTSIQIKLHNEADGTTVRELLREAFPGGFYSVHTWSDKQGPLLAAVRMQTVILNILLFLIITVAGFGILATFCMIVAEKTRDIGILRSLGASSDGILGIFLTYGLSLGMVGSGVGLVIGLIFVANINRIADLLARVTGREVFDPSIYYFQEIPTIVEPLTVSWIVAGAMLIAVVASLLPAFRAASLHPVEALRNE